MELTSPEFEDNELIPSRFTCDGEDINPELEITDVPAEAKSLVLIMDDPDAPDGTWVHWTVWGIDPETERIPAGTAPMNAVEGMTSAKRTGYSGPCPPSGTHRYYFKLFALDTKPDLKPSAQVSDLEEAMEDHLLARCELIGLYARESD
jgi:hypothetical protein